MSIKVTGIDHTIQTIQRFTDNGMLERLGILAQRLCDEIAKPIIEQTHARHAEVWSEPTENGYKIFAEGKDVLFIEFGTGDMAGVMDALYDQVPPEVGQGKWSETHAQMYSRYGFWVFAGRIYHYTEPHPAFYYAYQDMVQAIERIAKEVFGQ